MIAVTKRAVADVEAFRIAPGDSNYFALLLDARSAGTNAVCVGEIFTGGGRTPPNTHAAADEFFFVLGGTGGARCDGREVPLSKGDALLVRPGAEHVVENTGTSKLYTLTVMTPDEGFAELIRAGERVELDAEDLAMLCH